MNWFSCIFSGEKTSREHTAPSIEGIDNVKMYSYEELRNATRDFSPDNKVGQGGFASVYKGKLKDGRVVALKVIFSESIRGPEAYFTELKVIHGMTIAQENLVRLYGCCIKEEHIILVFHYFVNGDLAEALFGANIRNIQFTWRKRTRVCIGVARGLAFLHEEVEPYIIHGNISANNILLDRDLTPKISGFGLAKLLPEDESHVSTCVAGTGGYIAPEYISTGQVRRSSDVYSFGVLLLEIVTGRRNFDYNRRHYEEQSLCERSSSLVAATGKQQAQFPRKRDHPQFEGMRRSETLSVRWKSPNSPPDSTISRSLSDIWEFESKHNAPDIADETTLKSEKPSFDEEDNNIAVSDKPTEDEFQAVLPQSAASFYAQRFQKNDASVLAVCEGVDSLNRYLKDRKDDIKAGVPGRYLHAVIGSDVAGVGSFISTIMFAFFLNKTQKNSQFCTVPIINMKQADLSTRSELKWLLRSCRVDESSLVFIDEVELTYYDQYGNLKIVLVNGNKLPAKQEGLKEAIVEIFFCKEIDTQYTMVKEVTMAEDCSCCTLLTEQFLEASPEILAGQGFSRLLLSGILLDTENLTNAACTSKDKYTATLLINGAGRFGSNGLYQLLKHKLHDISELNVRDILRKEFKKWTRVAGKPNVVGSRLTISHIGMSSIGISLTELLNHEDSAADQISLFQESENLRLFMIVSGYYDKHKNFKREILVSTNTAELMRSFLHFFDADGTHRPLKALDRLGLNEEFRAFEIDDRLTSRRSIERILEEFGKSSRHRI